MRRKPTRKEVRLEKELAALKANLTVAQGRLRKELTKIDCYHDSDERYLCHRRSGDGHFILTRCGLCGRELAGRKSDAAEVLRVFGAAYRGASVADPEGAYVAQLRRERDG